MNTGYNTFINSVPAYDTVDDYLQTLQSTDPTVPQNSSDANATPGNIGWELTGWSNSDLSTKLVSSQYFWNLAASQFGGTTMAETAPTVPVIPIVTQSSVVATSSPSVEYTTPMPVTTTNTTNQQNPSNTAAASGSGQVGNTATIQPTVSGNTVVPMSGCLDPISSMLGLTSCVGPLGLVEWGIVAIGAIMLLGKHKK